MQRSSSFRSILLTAGLGVALAVGVAFDAFAQISGGPGVEMDPIAAGSGLGYGAGASANTAVLTTLTPSFTRAETTSQTLIQAFLYADVECVERFDLRKIDYAGLNDFFGEVIDNGAGAIESSDDYLVKLREYQKWLVKDSFKKLLSKAQDGVNASFFKKNIDEIY
ncbi:MAG: hypothetical protein HUK22_02490, partial [Thermoguttaceae bacterium]|nr:hypothetical protein [Thermoguttaceae bacterium]